MSSLRVCKRWVALLAYNVRMFFTNKPDASKVDSRKAMAWGLPSLAQALSMKSWDECLGPSSLADSVIARAQCLLPGLREQVAVDMLLSLAEYSKSLAEKDGVTIVLWAWRLFPFMEKDASSDPRVYLVCDSFSLKDGHAMGLPWKWIRSKGPLDPYKIRDQMLSKFPWLGHPDLVRSLMIACWDEVPLRCQHLDGPGRDAGDIVLRSDFDPGKIAAGKASLLASWESRALGEAASAPREGQGSSSSRI